MRSRMRASRYWKARHGTSPSEWRTCSLRALALHGRPRVISSASMQPTRLPLQTRWIFLPTRCAAFARRGDLRRAEGQRVPPGNKREKQICPRITRISANDLLLIEFRVHSRHSRASTLRHSHHPCDPWLRNLQRIFDHEQEHEYEEEIKSIGFDSCQLVSIRG